MEDVVLREEKRRYNKMTPNQHAKIEALEVWYEKEFGENLVTADSEILVLLERVKKQDLQITELLDYKLAVEDTEKILLPRSKTGDGLGPLKEEVVNLINDYDERIENFEKELKRFEKLPAEEIERDSRFDDLLKIVNNIANHYPNCIYSVGFSLDEEGIVCSIRFIYHKEKEYVYIGNSKDEYIEAFKLAVDSINEDSLDYSIYGKKVKMIIVPDVL